MPRDAAQAALALAEGGLLPERASSIAAGVDGVFAFAFWVSAASFALVVGLTVLFVVRYRARPSRPEPEPSPAHHVPLELLWTAIPLVLALAIFAVGARTWLGMTEARADDARVLRVHVTARKWSWWFDHTGGKGATELHLVAGRPAELVLASTDVVHSLYVPAFRLKQDAVPGRFTRMRVTPTVAGTYPIVCAEYCGTQHSRMSAAAVVHPDQASFDAWAAEGAQDASLVDLGKRVYEEKGCIACHSIDGSPGPAPTFKGLWGRTEKLKDGSSVKVDEAYVRESIATPSARVVAGFDDVMPPIPLEEREIQAIVAFLEFLRAPP
ncbi:MAG TPA: cytochrome c oxidase subunit II [Anaeromyxobacteraceae bacterium]|nr:cytochrome c oxidase subunit II [Anaeromyxobacteraceae bacterium]